MVDCLHVFADHCNQYTQCLRTQEFTPMAHGGHKRRRSRNYTTMCKTISQVALSSHSFLAWMKNTCSDIQTFLPVSHSFWRSSKYKPENDCLLEVAGSHQATTPKQSEHNMLCAPFRGVGSTPTPSPSIQSVQGAVMTVMTCVDPQNRSQIPRHGDLRTSIYLGTTMH